MLRRADRALYQAKERGRNQVVQLGAGITGESEPPRKTSWFAWLFGTPIEQLLQKNLVTAVPLNVAVEKLRGFIADHHGEVVPVDDHHIAVKIEGGGVANMRRLGDRDVPFVIDLQFETLPGAPSARGVGSSRTLVKVSIRPQRSRDRRQRDVLERARQLLVSLKSYLVAQEHVPEPDASALQTEAEPEQTTSTT
jgi:hypothetical protein